MFYTWSGVPMPYIHYTALLTSESSKSSIKKDFLQVRWWKTCTSAHCPKLLSLRSEPSNKSLVVFIFIIVFCSWNRHSAGWEWDFLRWTGAARRTGLTRAPGWKTLLWLAAPRSLGKSVVSWGGQRSVVAKFRHWFRKRPRRSWRIPCVKWVSVQQTLQWKPSTVSSQ